MFKRQMMADDVAASTEFTLHTLMHSLLVEMQSV